MAKREIHRTIWVCDRCGTEHEGGKPPNGPNDTWGELKIDQDAGHDHHGVPWTPAMREPKLLCGACLDLVWDALAVEDKDE